MPWKGGRKGADTGITCVVMRSLKEYERRLARDRRVLHVRDLDDHDIEGIRTVRPSDRARKLDHLMG